LKEQAEIEKFLLTSRIFYHPEPDRKQTGRIVATSQGEIVKEDARAGQMATMLGAAASNDVALAETLPRKQLGISDSFGRTPLMMAAWFELYEMAEWICAHSTRVQLQLSAKCIPKVKRFLSFFSSFVRFRQIRMMFLSPNVVVHLFLLSSRHLASASLLSAARRVSWHLHLVFQQKIRCHRAFRIPLRWEAE
jgi:hypothetical protein